MCAWLDGGPFTVHRPRRPSVLRSRSRPLLLLLAVSLSAVALAACGGGGSPFGSQRSDDEKRLAFEDCLRDEGLDVQSSADGRRTSIRVTSRGGSGRQTFGGPDDENGPFARCRKKTGWAPSPPTAAEQARARDEGLKLARCMRAHGVDMADPAADGRMMVRIRADSPTVQAAMRACGMGEPGFGPGGPGFAAGGK
jgi:hypothetical protein